jgi:hypothetical protein
MPKSFIIIDVDEDLKNSGRCLRKHAAVSAVDVVLDDGEQNRNGYDIVVKVEADSMRDLDEVELKIRTRKEVRSSLTVEVMEKDDTDASRRLV